VGSEARTRLGLAGLLAITLFGFYQVFGEGEYPGPAMLGMLIAAAIAIGARRLGVGTVLTVFASAAGLLLYLCFVFETRFTLYGLPTPDALRAIVRSVGHAAEKSSIDYAPVPVRVGYVIMIVSGMWATTMVAEIATFRWKRPLLASLPAVAMFSASMVLGTGRGAGALVVLFLVALLTFWGLESSHRLRSWGRWVPTFPGVSSPDEEPSSVTGSIARRMGAATVAAALIAPIFLPSLGDGLLTWRTGVAENGPGGGAGGPGGSGRIDPFVSIAPRLLQQTDMHLFTVEAESATYWRLQTLGGFDGQTWTPVELAEDPIRSGELGIPPSSDQFTRLEADFTMTNLQGEFLPTAGTPSAIDIGDDLEGDLRRATATGDVRLQGGIEEGLTYSINASLPDITYSDLLSAQPGDPGEAYSQLPPIDSAVQTFLDDTVGNIPSDEKYRQLVAIQNRLRNTQEFEYTTAPATSVGAEGASAGYLTTFLTRTKQGYCQQYATAFAILARQLDVPSRVVVGFLPGESVPASPGEYLIRGTDAHAWPEVFFEGWGWIPFEPTPRSSDNRFASAPAYTQPGAASGNTGSEFGAATGNTLGAGIDPRNQRPEFQGTAARERAQFRLPGSGTATPGPGRDAPWKETFTRLAIVLMIAALLFLVAVPTIKEWVIRRRYASARDARDLTAAAFEEFLVVAAELATPKLASESARAYALRIAGTRNLPQDRMARLASLYEAAEFGRSDPKSDHAGEAKTLAREIRARLWNAAPWWNRLARLFSPRGLRIERGAPAGLTGLFSARPGAS
jgi:transglutaminase-like putative cysteine protease